MKTLIINKRHELPFRKKILWDLATVLLWSGWIYLWKPLLVVLYRIITLKAEPDAIWKVIVTDVAVIPFHQAIWMMIATPIVLFILSRLNRHQAPTEHLIYSNNDYADYFKLSNEQLDNCVNSQLITVYHDEHGHITQLENKIA